MESLEKSPAFVLPADDHACPAGNIEDRVSGNPGSARIGAGIGRNAIVYTGSTKNDEYFIRENQVMVWIKKLSKSGKFLLLFESLLKKTSVRNGWSQ